jgi:hypothetical protein
MNTPIKKPTDYELERLLRPDDFFTPPEFVRGDTLISCMVIGNFLRWSGGDLFWNVGKPIWHEIWDIVHHKKTLTDDGGTDSDSMLSEDDSAHGTTFLARGPYGDEADALLETTASEEESTTSAKDATEWYPYDLAKQQLDQIDTHYDGTDRTKPWLEDLLKARYKPMRYATTEQTEKLRELITAFPNLREAARLIAGAVTLQAEKNLPVRLPRLILQGEPGCGKTEFLRQVASILDIPLVDISLSVVCGEFELPGSHRTWRSSKAGRLFESLLRSPVANPLFLFDEAERGNDIAQSVLLPFLENSTFRDNFMELDFSVSQINSVLITNNVDLLDTAVRSRCQLVTVAGLTDSERYDIVHRIYGRLREREEFVEFSSVLNDNIVALLLTQSLRETRVTLQSAMFSAALQQRRYLLKEDVVVSTQTKHPVGFLPHGTTANQSSRSDFDDSLSSRCGTDQHTRVDNNDA